MLSDFLALELYFGSPNAALYFEDLVKNYGRKKAENAIRAGDIKCRPLCLTGEPGHLAWLSEQGRKKARSSLS
ncbi:MAG: hypothetical protein R3E13_12105 [Alphaproteobacteria bacterium]